MQIKLSVYAVEAVKLAKAENTARMARLILALRNCDRANPTKQQQEMLEDLHILEEKQKMLENDLEVCEHIQKMSKIDILKLLKNRVDILKILKDE